LKYNNLFSKGLTNGEDFIVAVFSMWSSSSNCTSSIPDKIYVPESLQHKIKLSSSSTIKLLNYVYYTCSLIW